MATGGASSRALPHARLLTRAYACMNASAACSPTMPPGSFPSRFPWGGCLIPLTSKLTRYGAEPRLLMARKWQSQCMPVCSCCCCAPCAGIPKNQLFICVAAHAASGKPVGQGRAYYAERCVEGGCVSSDQSTLRGPASFLLRAQASQPASSQPSSAQSIP